MPVVVLDIFSPGGKSFKFNNQISLTNYISSNIFSSALSLIAEKGLGSDGLCHFPHPVGTEVTVSLANSMLLLTFDGDIYMVHLHNHITTYFGNIY